MNWKNTVAAISIVIFSVLIQTTLLSYIPVQGVKADLALVALVYFSLYMGCNVGQISGFIGGLTEDFLSTSPLGFYSLQKTTIGLIVGLFYGKIDQNSLLFPLLVIPLATFAKYLFSFILVIVLNANVALSSFFSLKIVIEMLYNLGFGIIIFLGIKIYRYARMTQEKFETND